MNNVYARLEHPYSGYDQDRIKVMHIDKSEFYLVKSIDVGGFVSYIEIEDYEGSFNSVNFEFYTYEYGEMVPYDIYTNCYDKDYL